MNEAMESTDRSLSLLEEMSDAFPTFRIVPKRDSKLCWWIDKALRLITLGRQSRFLTVYHTVLGSCLYVAPTWEKMSVEERYVLLRHERVHLEQRRRYTSAGMAFLYLIPIFPLGLAYGRARLEWEAYTETLRARAEVWGLDAARDGAFREQIVERFVGADYGWMWPFPQMVGRWYDREIARLESGVGRKSTL